MEVLANLNKRLVRFEKENLQLQDGLYQNDSSTQIEKRAFNERKFNSKLFFNKDFFLKLKKGNKKMYVNTQKSQKLENNSLVSQSKQDPKIKSYSL